MSLSVNVMRSRSSPRELGNLSDCSLQQVVSTHDYEGIPSCQHIYCMTIDVEDNTAFLFSRSALYTVAASGATAVLCGKENKIGYSDGMRRHALFDGPRQMVLDKAKMLMYVVDTNNHALRVVQLQTGFVRSLAGLGGVSGFLDGVGAAARFNKPTGIVMRCNGSLIICDKDNHALRCVNNMEDWGGFDLGSVSAVVVSTLCGGYMYGARENEEDDGPQMHPGHLYGMRDGPGEQALFHFPTGIAIDSKGKVVVADSDNNRIRYVDPWLGGNTKKIVGFNSSSQEWYQDGYMFDALVNHPWSVCVDEVDNIIVADTYNNLLRVICTCGMVVTLAGGADRMSDGEQPEPQEVVDGRGASVRFNMPIHVMLDHLGVVHVIENTNYGSTRRIKLGVQTCYSHPLIGL